MLISIFFIILMLAIAVIAIGGSIIRGILSILFGRRMPFGHHTTQDTHNQTHENSRKSSTGTNSRQSNTKKRKKIFDDSEGEYVDFEEIHD